MPPTSPNRSGVSSARAWPEAPHRSDPRVSSTLKSPYGEDFPAQDAQFAVDRVRVNWNSEAAEAARSYMALFDMSRDELYEQLTSPYGEEFTPSQALAGLAAVGY